LNENNIIIDVKNQRLAGIIDFCNGARRNFNAEFAPLAKYDFKLVRLMAKEYEKLTDQAVDLEYILNMQKVRCYGDVIYFSEKGNERLLRLYVKFLRYLRRVELLYDRR
jgi:hypothetical protein